ncbi:MAG: hypothetical protein O2962_01775 [Cyanobacteria bacterium]|nr:hypothetical protein [Cyanobacteriota bacterium]
MTKNKYFYPSLAALIGFLVAIQVVGPLLFNENVVQDDFRQSMFWVWRFWDPSLFPDDFIANLYSGSFDRLPLLWMIYAIAPFLTKSLIFYTKFAAIILAALTSVFGFLFFDKLSSNKILSLAFTAAFATMLWCTDHLSVMYARSFIWIFIIAVGYFKLRGKDHWASITTLISLFISPIAFLICFALQGFDLLLNYRQELFDLKSLKLRWLLINVAIVILVYKVIPWTTANLPFADSEWYSVDELKQLPEFLPGGRHPIFGSSLWDGSWFNNEHWGLGIGFLPISDILVWAMGFAIVGFVMYRKRYKVTELLTSIPACLLYASLALYIAAQILFPLLYMPSRFLGIPLLIIALVIIFLIGEVLLQDLVNTFAGKALTERAKASFLSILIIVGTIGFWFYFTRPQRQYTRYVTMNAQTAEIYKKLPKDAMVAAHPLLPDINLASAIAKRSVFMSYEHSTPSFNKQVLAEVRRRNEDSLKMVYAQSAQELRELMEKNHITHVAAFAGFYSPQYLAKPKYIQPYMGLLRDLTSKEDFYLWKFLKKTKSSYALFTEKSFELMEKN